MSVVEKLPHAANTDLKAIHFERWTEAAGRTGDDAIADFAAAAIQDPATARVLSSVFGNSPFLTRTAISDPEFLQFLIQNGADEAFANAIDPLESGEIEPV